MFILKLIVFNNLNTVRPGFLKFFIGFLFILFITFGAQVTGLILSSFGFTSPDWLITVFTVIKTKLIGISNGW